LRSVVEWQSLRTVIMAASRATYSNVTMAASWWISRRAAVAASLAKTS
jgi:hypothetical protein